MKTRRKREHQVPLTLLRKIRPARKIARSHTGGLFGKNMRIMFQRKPDGFRRQTGLREPPAQVAVARLATSLPDLEILEPPVRQSFPGTVEDAARRVGDRDFPIWCLHAVHPGRFAGVAPKDR